MVYLKCTRICRKTAYHTFPTKNFYGIFMSKISTNGLIGIPTFLAISKLMCVEFFLACLSTFCAMVDNLVYGVSSTIF